MSTVNQNGDNGNSVGGDSVDPLDDDYESEGADGRDSGPAPDAGSGPSATAAEANAERYKFKVVESNMEAEEVSQQIRATEPKLNGRAAALRRARAFNFKTEEKKGAGGVPITAAVNSDYNRKLFFEVMFGEGDDRPHIDLFRGRFVDYRGRLVDDRYSMMPMITAMEIAGLERQSLEQVRKSFKEYIMLRQINDLTIQFERRVPEWDGVGRLEERLIELFKCFDTETTRLVGKYFWLSVYNRIVNPGCQAPIVLSLFGAQFGGKSRFSHDICRIVLGRPKAQAVQLDLGADKNEFLRQITGNAVVANIGEMTGFTRGDLNKIKDFVVRHSDIMHYKYEGQFEQLRQWVSILDGNKYEGLQRDASGNRRFYPLFLGQLEDKDGQPQWMEEFAADFSDFEEKFWLIMAECREWILANGEEGYNDLVNKAVRAVKAFNDVEMANDRGTIRDDKLDTFLRPALAICELIELNGNKYKGVVVKVAELVNRIGEVSRNRCEVNYQHLQPKMAVMGGVKKQIHGDQSYFFPNYSTPKEFRDFLANGNGEDKDDKVKVWVSPKGAKDEGF